MYLTPYHTTAPDHSVAFTTIETCTVPSILPAYIVSRVPLPSTPLLSTTSLLAYQPCLACFTPSDVSRFRFSPYLRWCESHAAPVLQSPRPSRPGATVQPWCDVCHDDERCTLDAMVEATQCKCFLLSKFLPAGHDNIRFFQSTFPAYLYAISQAFRSSKWIRTSIYSGAGEFNPYFTVDSVDVPSNSKL